MARPDGGASSFSLTFPAAPADAGRPARRARSAASPPGTRSWRRARRERRRDLQRDGARGLRRAQRATHRARQASGTGGRRTGRARRRHEQKRNAVPVKKLGRARVANATTAPRSKRSFPIANAGSTGGMRRQPHARDRSAGADQDQYSRGSGRRRRAGCAPFDAMTSRYQCAESLGVRFWVA